MLKDIISDIKSAFRKPDNFVTKYIIVVVLWLVFTLIANLVVIKGLKITDKADLFLFNGKLPNAILYFWNLVFFPFTKPLGFGLVFSLAFFYWLANVLVEFLGQQKAKMAIFYSAYGAAIAYIVYAFFAKMIFPSISLPYFFNGFDVAILGLLFATVSLLPNFEIMIFTLPIKLSYIAVFYLLIDVLLQPEFAVLFLFAAVIGYFYIYSLKNHVRVFDWSSLKPKKPAGKQMPFPKPTVDKIQAKGGYPSQDEIDFLLDKINKKGGYDALTSEEKERLKKASEKQD
jgi:hypothetical protein